MQINIAADIIDDNQLVRQQTPNLRIGTGILPCQTILEMMRTKEIQATQDISPEQVQPASIDLRLGHYAYPVATSFLPGEGTKVMEKMRQLDPDVERFKIDLTNGAVLEKGQVYVIPLLESIALKSDVAAFANPKSSTGRLDILTRLIADESTIFDQVREAYKGQLYVEVAPSSFSVVVKTGQCLNQLRFRRARGETVKQITISEWEKLLEEGQIVEADINQRNQLRKETGVLPFTIDLRGSKNDNTPIGWRAKKHSRRIDLERRDYIPEDFWEPIHSCSSLVLVPDEFYILMSKESVAVPPEYAAEMVPYDTRAGEFRVHYAGFFDPGFGWNSNTNKAGGSRAVLEVRSHEVPFLLEDGQIVGWLRYERMSERPQKLYGRDIKSNYQNQGLKLAKQFA